MIDKIFELLQDFDVYYGWYREDIKDTHVTFFIYNSIPSDFSDNDYEVIEDSLQVDVWGTNIDEVNNIEKQIIGILKNNNFKWNGSDKDYENDIELFHNANRFVILE